MSKQHALLFVDDDANKLDALRRAHSTQRDAWSMHCVANVDAALEKITECCGWPDGSKKAVYFENSKTLWGYTTKFEQQERTSNVIEFPSAEAGDRLTPIPAAGAQRMLATAIEEEIQSWLDARTHLVDDDGHRLVVRSGHQPKRTVRLRRSKSIEDLIPWMYLTRHPQDLTIPLPIAERGTAKQKGAA